MFFKLSNYIVLGDNFVYYKVLNFSLFLPSLQIQKNIINKNNNKSPSFSHGGKIPYLHRWIKMSSVLQVCCKDWFMFLQVQWKNSFNSLMTDDGFTELCLWPSSVSFGILIFFRQVQMESSNSEEDELQIEGAIL